MLYDLGSVNIEIKDELVNIMLTYSPPTVINSLGAVFYNLLHSYWIKGYDVFASQKIFNVELQKLLQVFPEGRAIISGYYFLLAENSVFKGDNNNNTRYASSKKEIDIEYLVMLLTNCLGELNSSFEVALHTWLASNEKWLQLCPVQWIHDFAVTWHQEFLDEAETDEEVLRKYLIYIGEVNYFY